MLSKLKGITLTFLLALILAPVAALAEDEDPELLAACSQAPSISIQSTEATQIVVRYNENCTGEEWTKVLVRRPGSTAWFQVRLDSGDHSGWRTATDSSVQPEKEYCYRAENRKSGVVKTSATVCATTPLPEIKLGLISDSAAACGTVPTNPNPTEQREHVFITIGLAGALGIFGIGPTPQVRLDVESPLLSGSIKSTANYSVARVCTTTTGPYDWRVWVWNDDKLFPTTSPTLSTVKLKVHNTAVSRTTWTEEGSSPEVDNHFTEPNSGSRFFRENVTSVADKRVALLVPHGGAIERNTSTQIQAFVDELAPIGVNVWENDGQWGGGETHTRWHIFAGDFNVESSPGLYRLLLEPEFNDAENQDFQYAVAFHGFDDSTGAGIILGGLAPADVLCHVAHTIQDEAGTRSGEIGFHIANAGLNGQDILVEDDDGYVPNPANLSALEGTAQNNIVNRLSRAHTAGIWGGIQLEQSSCLRREMDCGTSSVCTNNQPECLHNVVARGTARAIEELLAGTDPAGACCDHFDQCP